MLLHSSACRGSHLLSSCSSISGRFLHLPLVPAPLKTLGALRTLAAMSYRGGRGGGGPNSHRGRGRGGGGGGRGGRGGGGGGGRGEQRWWDPQWRAERLRQMHGEVEKVDENEWWNRIGQLREGTQQELVVKRNFGRDGQNILADMAQRQGIYFNAYNKGKTLVFSKVPLPDYRADLDERHGSTQKEIKMSNQTERRVEDLLSRSKLNTSDSASTSNVSIRQSLPSTSSSVVERATDVDKEKLSSQLRDLQNSRKMAASARSMQSFREKLPAFNMREGFLKAVAANQVLVISGETGCGKTTQLPQFILEEEIDNLCGADCSIICTQPRRISAISVAARVAAERGEELGETVGYQIRLESKRSAQTRLLFCTTGVLLRRLAQEPDLVGVSHLLIDEIHERGMNEDFLIIILRDLLPRRPDLRLVLMSATINAELFSKYFGDASIMHIPGFTFPVAEFFLEDVLEKTRYKIKSEHDSSAGSSRRKRLSSVKSDPLSDLFEDIDIDKEYGNYSITTRQSLEAWSAAELDLSLVESTIEYICRYEAEGAILVFLTGWDEISKLLDKIKGNTFLGSSNRFLVLPLHGSMPTVNQREIFDRPPANMRKIVLATNIAESSITIDDVVYVIDCGKAKETSYDALNKLACLLPSWISKASAHQRRGRAGRVQPGFCYRLYPKVIHDAMPQFQLPEILRTPLQELCLTIKSLQLGAVSSFLAKSLQPPDPLSVNNAIELLKTIGALDDMEELTSLGRHLCTLPLDPNLGKMLLMGSVFQCLDPVLTIAAALAYRNPFVLPIDRKEEADAVKRSFAGNSCSDHIALLKAFVAWNEAKRSGRERSFCWENFLSPMTLKMMDDMRNQFFDLLSDIGFVSKTRGVKAYNQYGSDLEMVCAVLCAGLYPNVVQCKRRGKRTAFYTKDVGKVDIHPSSVNAFVNQFPLPYLVYSEKVKTASIYVRDSTNISDYALLLFGGSLFRIRLRADDPALLPLDLFLPCCGTGDAAGSRLWSDRDLSTFPERAEGDGEGAPAMSTATEAAKSGTAARVRCQRIGCDAMFTDDDNPEGSCQYHPSAPLFHDGMKEWSCCKQRSHDFSLFLAIPGCTTGKHTTEKPVTKAVSANPPKATPIQSSKQGVGADGCARCRQGFFCSDHGSQPKVQKPAATDDTKKEPVEKSSVPPPKKRIDINEPRTCKNKGCGKSYKEKDNHDSACNYHPGPAVFHDRMRGWKCCDIHVKEFDEFMEIPPCTKGWHNADAV